MKATLSLEFVKMTEMLDNGFEISNQLPISTRKEFSNREFEENFRAKRLSQFKRCKYINISINNAYT